MEPSEPQQTPKINYLLPAQKKKRLSRRISIRRNRKTFFKKFRHMPTLQHTPTTTALHTYHQATTHTTEYCNRNFGFTANPNLTHWENCKQILQQTTYNKQKNQPIKNLTFHNLCSKYKPPPGTKNLLGLGHKFIPQRHFPKPILHQTLANFKRDVRLKYTFAGEIPSPMSKNDKKIYIKSDWDPPTGNDELESRLSAFSTTLTESIATHNSSIPKSSNLTRLQYHTLQQLKDNDDIIVLLADKNLGPVTMDKDTYISRVLTEHLSDTATYQQLSEKEARDQLYNAREQLLYTFTNPTATTQNSLTNNQKTFFNRVFQATKHRIPTFYGLVKIHKQPWKLRPVVSCCGSFLASISSWIDYHLQSIRTQIPSFIQDSISFKHQLEKTPIPHDSYLFTADAVSMYTNIDVDHSITIVRTWFDTYKHELPLNLPPPLLIAALIIVMKNNVFTFGDTFWLQKTGTAMGTPCACMIATIYYAFHERQVILQKYKHHIVFYRRFIDDVFCIWRHTPQNTPHTPLTYQDLQNDMNNFGQLRWEFDPLARSCTFLDLTVTLKTHPSDATKLLPKFQTYEKPMNLHLYIPPTSTHPPGTIRSLVFGLLRKYYLQNSETKDFIDMTSKFFQRLINRGHSPTKLRHLFLLAAQNLDQHPASRLQHTSPANETLDEQNDKLFLRWRYHPQDLSRKQLRHIYTNTCESSSHENPSGFRHLLTDRGLPMTLHHLTIAYHRDKNLRDLLIPSRLRPHSKHSVSNFIKNSTKGDSNQFPQPLP